MSVPERPAAGPSRGMRLAVAASAVLAIAGAGAFYYATQMRGTAKAPDAYQVTVSAKACEPNEITVPAGRRSFEIVNASDRPVEWEILDGVIVVEERENIAPGFRQTLTARLAPGDYVITCGLLSNPRGTLHVTPGETAGARPEAPTLRAFIGPLSEYKVFVAQQGAQMLDAAERLTEAVKAGNLEEARALYEPARLPYKRIEAVAYRLADLKNAIDPLPDYLDKREQDPAFTGFHRIEYGLFSQNDLTALGPTADKLLVDLAALKDRLRALKVGPPDLADGAAQVAEHLAQDRVTGGENRYAGTDLMDIEANLAGIAKVVALLKPMVAPIAPDIANDAEAKLAAAEAVIDGLKKGEAFPAYGTLDEATRKDIAQAFRNLADALNRINPALGLS
ncbi:iron uptake system protein EfeO [Chelatococcus sp. GCM10030263]|uniref:iron uptake system protein EfeO n=1 Tax=Chelatococcus sp. GCM10030263 TaxID=3273387 RepID=UPI00361A8D8D